LDSIGALTDDFLNIILVEMLAPVLTEDQHRQVVRRILLVILFMH
jgi:hypothetical protein